MQLSIVYFGLLLISRIKNEELCNYVKCTPHSLWFKAAFDFKLKLYIIK